MSTPGLNRGGKPLPWAFIRPLAVATLPCAGGAIGGPSLRKGATCVRMCGVWRGLRGATSVLSLSMEEGRPTFGIMAGIWANF